MSAINVRYNGNIVSLQEGFNYSPQNFGTARLKYRVNSTSVGELGLTTNTNAMDYCKLKVRVGGQIAYIGRVSSTTYTSGQAIDYNGSVVGSRSQIINTAQDIVTSSATLPVVINTSSVTTYTNSGTRTLNSGSNSGTAAANPTIRTITNATGSTVTSKTASAQVASQTIYSYSYRVNIVDGTARIQYKEGKTSSAINYNYSTGGNYSTKNASHGSYYSWKNTKNSSAHTKYWSAGIYNIGVLNNCITWGTTMKEGNFRTYTTGANVTVSGLSYSPTTQYVHHYNYSTRWSYSWSSCKKETAYTTTYVSSTTNVSETLHNMNI